MKAVVIGSGRVGSAVAKVGQAADYSLVVRNICGIPVQGVTVRVRVPNGLSVQGTEPKASTEAGILVWELGTLMAKQERVMQMKLLADAKGDVAPQAWVTLTGSSVLRLRVREPKLTVKCATQEKVLVGDPAAFTLTVANPGDDTADLHGVAVTGIVEDPTPLRKVYEPGHPDADAKGYVTRPNVDAVVEMTDMVAATRAFQANVTAFEATKSMAKDALRIIN